MPYESGNKARCGSRLIIGTAAELTTVQWNGDIDFDLFA